MGLRRVYRAPSLGEVMDDVVRSIVAPGSGSNVAREAARSDGGN